MAKFDKRLKSILTKAKIVEGKKVDAALETAASENKPLSQVLIEQNVVDERTLIGSIAREMNIPPIDLTKTDVSTEALESLTPDLAEYYGVLPIAKLGNILTVAVANPFDVLKLDDIGLVTGCQLMPVVSTEVTIRGAIDRFYRSNEQEMEELLDDMVDPELEFSSGEQELEDDNFDISAESGDSPVVKLVNMVIYQAIKNKVSDIHIEAFEKRVVVRYRQDGVLYEALTPPKKMQNAITSRIKVMSDLDIAERRRPQDGKFQLRVEGRQVDFRVSVLPVVYGEKVVLRILDSSNLTLNLDALGFEEEALKDFRNAIEAPYGMILVTGPTGSGKSTTLYSALKEIMSVEDNIVTVEDPVEYQLEGINQVPVNVKRGLTFAGALRSILRQDPDKILIGEIRDLETIEIAIKAALTGHLVLSTLHTNDAPSTITRMVDMGVDPFMIATSVVLVSAQRLCRRLCTECREPVDVPEERLLALGLTKEDLKGQKPAFHKAKGCTRCAAGYKGRFAVLETLPVSETVRRIVISGKSAVDIKKTGLDEGMVTLRRCGMLNAMRGNTSLEEVLRVTMAD
ncbi:MAG: type IV-A pilus assembly ATPase PilB [Planctomycetota bacterium]|jgi:type IV pilus assembly protein PilB